MKIKIYDYNNQTKYIDIPDKKIVRIFVRVWSGDETGYIEFVDDSMIEFDSSDSRMMDFYDGEYFVSGEDIKKWLMFEPSDERTASYERQELFS